MIYTRLAGGLGNQIFQLAAAMAVRSNYNEKIFLDPNSLNNYSVKRDFALPEFFNLNNIAITELGNGFKNRFFISLMKLRPGRYLPLLGVNDKNFSSHLLNKEDDVNKNRIIFLDGYFQNAWTWDVFNSIRSQLLDLLLPKLNYDQLIGQHECCIHIRGGDFLNSANEIMQVVNGDFYIRCLEEIRKEIKINSINVITDDVYYAKSLLSPVERLFPEVKIDYPLKSRSIFYDFLALQNAKSRIIGNSTFAWWAAALDSKSALTYGPSKWIKGQERSLILPWERTLLV